MPEIWPPNWRKDVRYYLALTRTTAARIRWEFVRRHSTYLTAWEENRVAGQRQAFCADCSAKFGMDLLSDPRIDDVPEFVVPDLVIPPWRDDNGEFSPAVFHFLNEAAEKGMLLVAIDPSLPIAVNLESIEKVYTEYAQEIGDKPYVRARVHLQTYPEYLRIIDARQAGATYDEIQAVYESQGAGEIAIGSLEKRYQRALEAAEKLTGLSREGWTPKGRA